MDSDFWKVYYQDQNLPWDASSITTPIKEYVDQLKDKRLRILIPGCGNAHEAEYLHQAGFQNVFICDWVAEALANFSKRVPTFPKENLIQGDFFLLKGEFDLVLEQTFFCAIVPSLRSAYAKKMHKLLSENGALVGVLFAMKKEDGPPFGGSLEEYHRLFDPVFREVSIAPCYNSIKPRAGSEVFISCKK